MDTELFLSICLFIITVCLVGADIIQSRRIDTLQKINSDAVDSIDSKLKSSIETLRDENEEQQEQIDDLNIKNGNYKRIETVTVPTNGERYADFMLGIGSSNYSKPYVKAGYLIRWIDNLHFDVYQK